MKTFEDGEFFTLEPTYHQLYSKLHNGKITKKHAIAQQPRFGMRKRLSGDWPER